MIHFVWVDFGPSVLPHSSSKLPLKHSVLTFEKRLFFCSGLHYLLHPMYCTARFLASLIKQTIMSLFFLIYLCSVCISVIIIIRSYIASGVLKRTIVSPFFFIYLCLVCILVIVVIRSYIAASFLTHFVIHSYNRSSFFLPIRAPVSWPTLFY